MDEPAPEADDEPNLFVLGAMRSGTSLLHQTLDSHPAVFMAPLKEPKSLMGPRGRFEGPEAPVPEVPLDRYETLFEEAEDETWRGEASVFYLASEVAADRVAKRYPNARFIATLREPVERLLSHWRFNRLKEREPLSLFEALDAEGERLADGWSPYYAYAGLSRYAEQLDIWTARFERDQFLFLTYDLLDADEDRFFDEVFDFLGVDPDRRYVPRQQVSSSKKELIGGAQPLDGLLEGVVPRPVLDVVSKLRYVTVQDEKVTTDDLPDERLAELSRRFEEDVRAVEDAIGRDLDAWRYRA